MLLPPLDADSMSLAAMVHGLRCDGLFDQWQARALEIAQADDSESAPWLAAPSVFVESRVALHTGYLPHTAELLRRAFAELPEQWWAPYARATAAELAVVAGLPSASDLLAAAVPDAAENDWAGACLTRAAARATGDRDALLTAAESFERIDARFESACTEFGHRRRGAGPAPRTAPIRSRARARGRSRSIPAMTCTATSA